MKRRTSSRAFTLIELLLVLVILAVLAAVVIPKLTGRVEDAKRKSTLAAISNLKQSLETYEIDNGKYPSTQEGLAALVEMPSSTDNQHWTHKYIDEIPVDGWGTQFDYRGPGDAPAGMDFDIVSAGPTKEFGNPENEIHVNTK